VGGEKIHRIREYHSDIRSENVLIRQRGIYFEPKSIDFFNWGSSTPAKIREDVIQLVHLLHEVIGGQRWYARQPPEIKSICGGT